MRTALIALILKELRQISRDKRLIQLLVVAPVIQLLVLGYAVDLDVKHVPTVIADEDGTATSRGLADRLLAGEAFDEAGRVDSGAEAMRVVARGAAVLAVVIPAGTTARLTAGESATVQILVDGADSNRALIGANAATSFFLRESLALVARRQAELTAARGVALSPPSVRVEPRVLYNPTLNSPHYFIPGVAATLLLIITIITTGMNLAREKEAGTLEQVLVTPIRPVAFILGKSIPVVLIGLLDLVLVVTVGHLLFGVPVRGSLALLFFGGFLYLASTIGVGLMLSSLVRTQQQALMGAFFFLVPAMMLSGFMTPIDNMPGWLQPVTVINPVRHYVEILRSVLLKDASLGELAGQLTALASIAVAVLSVSVWALRRRLV